MFAVLLTLCLATPPAALLGPLLSPPHGGQYLPPHPEPGTPLDQLNRPVVQPGYGPFLEVQPDRWEWWFEFNREELVDRRARMRALVSTPVGVPEAGATSAVRGPVPARVRAFEELQPGIRRQTVLPVLMAATKHHNRDVRATALLALSRLGFESAWPTILKGTQDKDLFVRTVGILALGFGQSGASVERLGSVLGDRTEDSEVRQAAAVAAGLLGTSEAVQLLERLLRPRSLQKLDHQLQAGVVYAAGVAGEAAPVAALLKLAGSWDVKQDARLQSVLAVALGRSGRPEVVPELLRMLSGSDNQLRRSAAAGLEGVAAHLEGPILELLLGHAQDESDLATLAALYRALGRVRRPESRQFLRAQLERANTILRPQVAMALALDGHAGNGGPLLKRLEDEHETSARAALVTSLALLGDVRLLPVLQKDLGKRGEPVYVGALCRAAGLLGQTSPELVERLGELARTVHDVEVSRLAVLGLGLLGARDELDALTAGLGEVPSTVDRAARVFALGQVGDRRTLSALLALAEDDRQPSYVLAYTIQALGEVSDARLRSPSWRLSRLVNLHHDLSNLVELYRML